MNTLQLVQKHFPNVARVVDAKEPVLIEVTKHDANTSKRKNHEECAMAVACKRKLKADGVIMARSIAYLIKDKVAIRYKVPGSVGREVTAFDRGAEFIPGIYMLSVPDHKLGHVGGSSKKANGKGSKGVKHVTTNIRTVLGGKEGKLKS